MGYHKTIKMKYNFVVCRYQEEEEGEEEEVEYFTYQIRSEIALFASIIVHSTSTARCCTLILNYIKLNDSCNYIYIK
jgi:hypothetical protein